RLQTIPHCKGVNGFGFHSSEVHEDFRRFDVEAVNELRVMGSRQGAGISDLEGRLEATALHLEAGAGVEIGDGEQVVALEDLTRDTQLLGIESHGGDAASLAVAA